MNRKLLVFGGHILVPALIVSLIIFGLAEMRPQPERQPPQIFAPTVFTENVAYGPTQLTVFAQGEVRPKQEIDLIPQVAGQIVEVSSDFADGGVITKGQTLIQIEDADYRLAVTRSRAQVATAKTALEIEQAESELARQDFEELQKITGKSSPSDLTLRRPQLARAEADYRAAIANLREAELALARTSVKAPFDGRVRSIQANIGQYVTPGVRLGRIFSTDVAEVRLPLTDDDLGKLRLSLAFSDPVSGPQVDLSAVVAGAERQWLGRIVRVDAAIDASTRQVAAIVQVDDPYGEGADNGFPFAVGLYTDAIIEGPVIDRAIVLPRVAIRGADSVYVIEDDDTVREQPVEIAAYTGEGVVITGGLSDGERVAVSRVGAVDGDLVRPLQASSLSRPAEEPVSLQTVDTVSTEDTESLR